MNPLTIKRDKDNILISVPASIENKYLDELLAYLNVKTIASQSSASEADILSLADEINADWWQKNKERFLK